MIKNLRETSVYDINPVIYEKVYEWFIPCANIGFVVHLNLVD